MPALVSSVKPASWGVCLLLGMRGMRALASCACSCSVQAFCMLATCVLHAFGCSCSGLVVPALACAYDCVRVLCLSCACLASACFLLVFCMRVHAIVCMLRAWLVHVIGFCMFPAGLVHAVGCFCLCCAGLGTPLMCACVHSLRAFHGMRSSGSYHNTARHRASPGCDDSLE